MKRRVYYNETTRHNIPEILIFRISTSLQKEKNANVGFISFLKRHDKPLMDGSVRRVNFRLDQAMMGCDMAHIGITDLASFVRDDYMRG
jgi:hypothetical protein